MSAGGANSEIWLLLRAFINTQFFPSGGSSDEGIHHGMERFEKYKL